MPEPTTVAIVIPALNESASIQQLLREIDTVMSEVGVPHTVTVVDDGSTDDTSDVALRNGARVIRSSRNTGKTAALQAGFDATADASVVVTMDADLQDDPSEIPRLLEGLLQADVVNGWKQVRKDSKRRRLQSAAFGWTVRKLTGIHLRDFNSGFKAYRRRVLDNLSLTGDQHRLIPVLAVEAGFSVIEIPVNHRAREHGKSRFGLGRVLRGPMDLATVLFITRFGSRPLHMLGGAGVLVAMLGFAVALHLTWLKFVGGEAIGDRPLLLLAVLMIIAGLQLFAVGLLGEMILYSKRPANSSSFRELQSASVASHDGAESEELVRPAEQSSRRRNTSHR